MATHVVRLGATAEGKSKRQTLNRKYRNEHLVKQHGRKLKKMARKAEELGIKPSATTPQLQPPRDHCGSLASVLSVCLTLKITLSKTP